jgi:hypothetical protein
VRDQVSHPYSPTGIITVLYSLIFTFFESGPKKGGGEVKDGETEIIRSHIISIRYSSILRLFNDPVSTAILFIVELVGK